MYMHLYTSPGTEHTHMYMHTYITHPKLVQYVAFDILGMDSSSYLDLHNTMHNSCRTVAVKRDKVHLSSHTRCY